MATSLVTKQERQDVIRDIIGKQSIETQEDMVRALRERGFHSTQATVSRDIREMRLLKVATPDGAYKYALSGSEAQEVPGRMIYFISESIVSVQTALNIVVVKTRSGAAGAVAESLDGMAWPEVVGTLAGDNTIMIVAHDNQSAARVEEKIERLNK